MCQTCSALYYSSYRMEMNASCEEKASPEYNCIYLTFVL